MARSLCSGCKTTFTSESAFDMHRTGNYGGPIHEHGKVIGFQKSERRCLSVEEMLAKDMVQNDKGWWTSGIFDNSWLKERSDGAAEGTDNT